MMASLKFCIRSCIACLLIVLLSFILWVCDGRSDEKDTKRELSLTPNPFLLPQDRAIPGKGFRIEVPKDLVSKKDLKIFKVRLEYETLDHEGNKGTGGEEITENSLYFEHSDSKVYLVAEIPSWDEIKDIKTQKWRGILAPYKANITVHYQVKGQENEISLPVGIADGRWAVIWGLIAVLGSFFLIWVLMRKPKPSRRSEGAAEGKAEQLGGAGKETNNLARSFFLFPLRFAVTPIGTYSISVTQVLLWTYITVFATVYVFWLTGAFLEITSQLLMLLGIGGGTALASKINAISRSEEIPSKYMDLVDGGREGPELRNLISIGGKPNIFKFQMLVFTLLIGYIAVVEIIQTRAFPAIPDNMIALMGVSSAVYLGNEVTQRDKRKVWKEVKKIVAAIEKHATENNKPIDNSAQIEALDIPEVAELKALLEEIYS